MKHTLFSIRPEHAAEAVEALRPKAKPEREREETPYAMEEFEDESTGETKGAAVIRASGVLAMGVEGWWGTIDFEELLEELEEADRDANVAAIVLHLDTPGGTVNGTPEHAARIAALTKPLLVWTEEQLCSAGYWLAASADAIMSYPSAMVGSIGCVLAFYDYSQMLGDAGVAVQVFRTGELKAAGYPGTSLSEAEAAHFQSLVDGVGVDFQAWVLEYRPGIDLGLFDGRAVSGKQGLDLGLVDAIHNTRQEAIQQFMEVFA